MSDPQLDENIFVVYFGDDDRADLQQTTFPTEVPGEREAYFRECPLPPEGLEESEIVYESAELWGVAPIQFLYSVQLNVTNSGGFDEDDDAFIASSEPTVLSPRGKQVLQTSLSNAIINSIYENECPDFSVTMDDGETDDEINFRHLRRYHSRRLNIQSISPGNGNGHRLIGECMGAGQDGVLFEDGNSTQADETGSNNTTNNTSTTVIQNVTIPSCQEVDGTVLIGFDTLGERASSFQTVGVTVVSRIQKDMRNGAYIEQINADMEPFNVQITDMQYIDSDYFERVDDGVFAPLNSMDWAQPHSTMSKFSTVTIPIIVLLFLLMICFCWCSYSSYAKILRKRFAVYIFDDNDSDDGQYTEDNSHFEPYRKPKVVETLHQVEPQPSNLSRRSSYMDVPHCNKPQCRLCRHQSNHRAVSMIGELSKDFGGEEDGMCINAESLETTFQDMSLIKSKGYRGDDEEAYPTRTYSTVPHQSRNLFSLSGKRSPSLIRIVAEDKHNQDGFYNEPEMVNFVKVNSLVDKPRNSNSRNNAERKSGLQQLSRSQSAPSSTPWGAFFSVFGGNDGRGGDTGNGITDFGDFTCNPRGLHNVAEIDDDDRSDDPLDFNSIPVPRSSTMYSYTPSPSSKLEATRTTWSLPTGWWTSFTGATDENKENNNANSYHSRGTRSFGSSSSAADHHIQRQMSMEDTIVVQDPAWVAAYNGKSQQSKHKEKRRFKMRRYSLDNNLESVPFQVGKKRTWTDDRGRVRQEVAL
jgi:hypothetical protein